MINEFFSEDKKSLHYCTRTLYVRYENDDNRESPVRIRTDVRLFVLRCVQIYYTPFSYYLLFILYYLSPRQRAFLSLPGDIRIPPRLGGDHQSPVPHRENHRYSSGVFIPAFCAVLFAAVCAHLRADKKPSRRL